jgi:hypothetical protein
MNLTYHKHIWYNQEVQLYDQLAFLRCVVILKPFDLIPFTRFFECRHPVAESILSFGQSSDVSEHYIGMVKELDLGVLSFPALLQWHEVGT